MPDQEPILQVKGVCKRFGAVQALEDVDFEVGLNEVVGLVGDNGAGKSTLIKILSGVYQPDECEYYFEGKRVEVHTPKDANALGIETVYQDLALCDNLDVTGNLYLGREKSISLIPGLVDIMEEIDMEAEAKKTVANLHINIPSLQTHVAALSGGQRQSVAVARAVMWNSKVVILDEPTAALGVEQTHQVKNLIKRLREQGLAVVVISHNLADVFDISDRIIVLRLGKRVATFDTHETDPDQVVAAITGAKQASKESIYGED
jgi:D-xylose transport system ATP-binding protein